MIWENFFLHTFFCDALYFLKKLISESENLWNQLTTGTGNIISKITVHTTKLAFLEQKREITFAIVLCL